MTTAEQNYLLLQEIEANRRFLLMAYQQNPKLLKNAEARIKQMFEVTASCKPDEVNPAGMRKQRGVSLIELVMFIVIISVAVTGVLLVMNQVTAHSADSLVRKQALAIAESLLEEVELMPFTYCDPNDPSGNAGDPVLTTSTASCTAGWSQDVITGPTPNTETRYSTADPFDNVADYGNFNMPAPTGIFSMTDGITPVAGLGNYSANVSITRAGTALLGVADNGTALRITITVTAPDNSSVVLDGYRTRYAPNDLP